MPTAAAERLESRLLLSAVPVLVQDINSRALDGDPTDLTVAGDILFFVADGELWASDGTDAGTRMVADIEPGAAASNPTDLTAVDNTLFFVATSGGVRSLWTSDGTAAGTRRVSDPVGGMPTYDGLPTELTAFDGRLFFAGQDSQIGRELWVSDGTAAGQ